MFDVEFVQVVGYGDENRDRSYSSNRNEYDNNYDNDDNNDSGDDYRSFGSSSGRRGNNPRVRGRDPRPFGQDMADSKEIYDDKDSMLVSLDVWITSAKDWEQKRKNRYRSRDRGEYQGDKYKKNRNNKDKDYKGKEDSGEDKDDYKRKDYGKKDNYRKKRSYKCVRFPVRHYKEVRRFPIRKCQPLCFSSIPSFSFSRCFKDVFHHFFQRSLGCLFSMIRSLIKHSSSPPLVAVSLSRRSSH